MKILMVASEATPYSKTGGLADVIGSLPFALANAGEQVAVLVPLYRSTRPQIESADRVYDRMRIRFSSRHQYDVDLRRVTDRGVQIYFVDAPALYDRPELYGEGGVDYEDNHVRFAVLCQAALGVIRSLFRPHIIHCHDWQSGLLGPFMREGFPTDPTFYGLRLLFTVHNLGYQGLFDRSVLGDLGLPPHLFHPDRLEFYGRVNLLKAGLTYADAISTVSPTYAREIQTPELGFSLDGLLRSRGDVVSGIVNGVDYAEWNPKIDRHIAANYDADDLSGKRACKADLLQTMGLSADNLDRPVLGIVSRFVGQKGFDLIEEIRDDLLREDVCVTALGTGEPRFETMMGELALAHPDRVAVRIAYDNTLAHKIEAGADLFLMPSRYEPCGLNQIYSLRYGTLPIVRATGGLEDTITPETGFKFHQYSGAALIGTIRHALQTYKDRAAWTKMVSAAMEKDFSWNSSAAEYVTLYRSLLGRRQAA